jgi:inhibitor of cysteine peptidase
LLLTVFEMLREIKKKTAVYSALAVLLATTLGAICLNFGILPLVPPVSAGALSTFSSQEELENYLMTEQKTPYYYVEMPDLPRMPLPQGVTQWSEYRELLGLWGADVKAIIPHQSGPEFSATNVQVAGVDEADLVKTDGEYIYIVSENNLTIFKAYPAEDAEILSQISLNGTIRGIFIDGDKLAVFGESYFYQTVEFYYAANATVRMNETTLLPLKVQGPPFYRQSHAISSEAFVKVYNVADRANPLLTNEVTINGTYSSSRRIGDYVYAVTSQPTYWRHSKLILPMITSPNKAKIIQPNEIYHSNVSDNSYAFTTIVSINLNLDWSEPEHKTFLLGSASCMYVSLNNIYITMLEHETFEIGWTESTLIYRVHMQDGEIECEASGEVPGRVLNQFSMDEYGEYFRIATTIGQIWSSGTPSRNNLYVLNMSLSTVGKLEDLAPGETIHSARFMGDRCYLVTFRKIDPLFVIDLETPDKPRVLGELKITGYSDYLHPYDENHIIGVGKETVGAGQGDFSWYQGVKISLFDVSDVENPREIDKYEIGDRGTDSPVLTDHKAFLFDRSKNLLVIPVLVAEVDEEKYPNGAVPPNAYGEYVWQGAYVFNVSLAEGFMFRGGITHLENNADKESFYYYSPYYVKRALYIGNVLYTISDKKIKMNSLETLQEINEVELP